MTPEKQRIAIAEACGWFCIRPYIRIRTNDRIRILKGAPKGGGSLRRIPDYLNDLNAMHEAEKVLTKEQRGLYLCISYDIVVGVKPYDDIYVPDYWEVPTEQAYEQMTMSAAQRAEAFLRTIGKWEEAP